MLSPTRISNAVIKLPPNSIPLTDENYSRLQRTTSPNEFKGVLLSILTEMTQNREQEKQEKQKRPRWFKRMTESEPRTVKRTRESTYDSATSYEPERSDEEVQNGNKTKTREAAIDTTPATEEGDEGGLEANLSGRLPTPSSSVSSEQAVKDEDRMDVDDAEPIKSFDNLITQIESTTPKGWDEFKPELIDHLKQLRLGQSAPPTIFDPYTTEGSPLKKLKAGLTAFSDEISSIPPDIWRGYEEGLTKLCGKPQIMTMNYSQRHYEIVRLVLNKEELRAMKTGQWAILLSLCRLCATLAEVTGPPEADVQSKTDEWIASKSQEISYLENAVRVKDRGRVSSQR